jgi:hypothetical protein
MDAGDYNRIGMAVNRQLLAGETGAKEKIIRCNSPDDSHVPGQFFVAFGSL